MKKKLLLLLFLIVLGQTHAQVKRKNSQFNLNNKENPFLQQQWWIGLKGGFNASNINVDKSYSVIMPSNYSSDFSAKKYEKWKPFATQIGLEATYFFRGFSASVQPTYTSIRFSYENNYLWYDPEIPSNRLELKYKQEQKLSYIFLPLLLKYELNLHGITPYVEAGVYTSFLLDAGKTVTVSGVDYASGGANSFEYDPVSVGAKDQFSKNQFGFIGGAGLYYNIGNIRLNLDIQYRIGRSIINSTTNRYKNDRLSGVGDAMDDITLDNIAASLGVLFPLRFLSSGFKSYDK
jgi:opacity protein-like surface antigen